MGNEPRKERSFKLCSFCVKKHGQIKTKQHTIVDGEESRQMEVIKMKKVKLVDIPVDMLVSALWDGRPRYISISGVRVNILEAAAALITSLMQERDEAEMKLANITEVALEMMPKLGMIFDFALPKDFDFDAEPEDTDGTQDEDELPKATVISALIKHEMV